MILLKSEIGTGGKNLGPFCSLFDGPPDNPICTVFGLCSDWEVREENRINC